MDLQYGSIKFPVMCPEVLVVTNTASYKLQHLYVCYHTNHVQVHKFMKYYYENEIFASSMWTSNAYIPFWNWFRCELKLLFYK